VHQSGAAASTRLCRLGTAAAQPEQRLGVGADADDLGAASDLPFDPLEWLVDEITLQCCGEKSANVATSSAASRSIESTMGS
jgi:hypothetical protein